MQTPNPKRGDFGSLEGGTGSEAGSGELPGGGDVGATEQRGEDPQPSSVHSSHVVGLVT